MKGKKILVLGGTGAMGVYLVPELASMGYRVDVVSLDKVESENPQITYIQANAKDDVYLQELVKNKYEAIVDFLIYSTKEFTARYKMMLSNTNHYVFFSSYRVYADSPIITESSPRLLDVSKDKTFLEAEEFEYSLYKARQEDVLRGSSFDNWTIVRPAITYSKRRFQLVTLEAHVFVYRALNNFPVALPKEALSIQGTMSWGGDVAKMLARLILNPVSLKETYTVSTSEHKSWKEIADYYKEIIGLEYIVVDTEEYLSCFSKGKIDWPRYQLKYDRCFNRVVDNAKVLAATGLKQSDFITLKQGLMKELSALPKNTTWYETDVNVRMDELLKKY